MTFPTGTVIPTTNVASPDSDPSQARVDIYNLIVAFNQLVASINGADGVAVLNGSGKIANSLLPSSLALSGDISLQPSTGIVNINNVLRLAVTYTADLGSAVGTDAPTAGDLTYLIDGDAGQPCLGCYDGTKWRIVRFMTEVGDVGAGLQSISTLTVEADA
jgi:hypothetical protein